MLQENTVLLFTKHETTHDEHKAKMIQLKEFYDKGWITKLEAVVQFLDYLEITTGYRPYKKPFPYRKAA